MKEKINQTHIRVDDEIEFVINKRSGAHSNLAENSGQIIKQEYSFLLSGASKFGVVNADMENCDSDVQVMPSLKREKFEPYVASTNSFSNESPGSSHKDKQCENQPKTQLSESSSLPLLTFKEDCTKNYKSQFNGHFEIPRNEGTVKTFGKGVALCLPNHFKSDKSDVFNDLHPNKISEVYKTNHDFGNVRSGSYHLECGSRNFIWEIPKDHLAVVPKSISTDNGCMLGSICKNSCQNEVITKNQICNFQETVYNSQDIKPVLTDLNMSPYISPASNYYPKTCKVEGDHIGRSSHWLSSKMLESPPGRGKAIISKQESVKNNILKRMKKKDNKCKSGSLESALCSKRNIPVHKSRKTEVDLLYDNLKEISWAQDKSFTNLLVDTDNVRRLERISNPKVLLTALDKAKSNLSSCSALSRRLPVYRRLRRQDNDKIKYKHFNTQTLKDKHNGKQNDSLRKKPSVIPKPPRSKVTYNVKNIGKIKSRSLYHKMKAKDDNKQDNAKQLQLKSVSQCHTSRKSEFALRSSKNVPSNQNKVNIQNKQKRKTTQINKNHVSDFLSSCVDDCGEFSETIRNTPELRVTLEPLENSNQWNSESHFHKQGKKELDALKKKNIQQTMFKVFAGMNQGHVESVLREVQDSIMDAVSGMKPSRKRKYEEESVRTSVRQSECAFRYKEIVVKKHQNYIQVVLVPNALKQNCLSIEAMRELKEAFISAKKDPNCKAVLLNSSGSFFCSGIDLSQLYGPNKKQMAEEMAVTIRDLILTLGIFPKPVVAAVNGDAIGLGVALLTFCDIVLASDKATFSVPSAALGYLPEAAITLTLPQVVGSTVASEMLLQGRKLTAQQSLRHGLVSEVLWPTRLMEGTVPRMHLLVSQSSQVMEATKTMVRCHLWEKLAVQLEREWRLLPSQWLSATCQQKIKKVLQSGWLLD